jgi:hypothetical protein
MLSWRRYLSEVHQFVCDQIRSFYNSGEILLPVTNC